MTTYNNEENLFDENEQAIDGSTLSNNPEGSFEANSEIGGDDEIDGNVADSELTEDDLADDTSAENDLNSDDDLDAEDDELDTEEDAADDSSTEDKTEADDTEGGGGNGVL